MSKKEWGPIGWEFLHQVAIGYPNDPSNEERQWALVFLNSVSHILPCVECQHHFQQLLREFPPDVRNSCTFQTWLFHAHNKVNQRLGKEIFTQDQYHRKYGRAIALHKERKKKGK